MIEHEAGEIRPFVFREGWPVHSFSSPGSGSPVGAKDILCQLWGGKKTMLISNCIKPLSGSQGVDGYQGSKAVAP